jgi:hypothetical protein
MRAATRNGGQRGKANDNHRWTENRRERGVCAGPSPVEDDPSLEVSDDSRVHCAMIERYADFKEGQIALENPAPNFLISSNNKRRARSPNRLGDAHRRTESRHCPTRNISLLDPVTVLPVTNLRRVCDFVQNSGLCRTFSFLTPHCLLFQCHRHRSSAPAGE